ncbi:MAG: hypothetical protein ABI183_21485 [Polyangiaceae bacterium]
MMVRSGSFMALCAVIFACGSSSSGPSISDGDDTIGGDGGTSNDGGAKGDGSASSDGSVGVSVCPSTQPADQSACSAANARCEYGADPDMGCDPSTLCSSDKWNLIAATAPASGVGTCPSTSGNSCPGSYASISYNAECPNPLYCHFPEGDCWCLTRQYGVDGGTASGNGWACGPSPSTCPVVRPRLGEACGATQSCTYGDQVEQCNSGTWVLAAIHPPF